jgi:dihydropteroate synthase
MGVLNVTPDSFSDGGLFYDTQAAIRRGVEMAGQGAGIIDIGGESTRPGALSVAAAEQIRRVVPVIKALKGKISVPISVDTSSAEVAQAAVKAGAVIINDISGLRADKGLARVAARYKTGCVIMHIRGTPRTMQKAPCYKDLMGEICAWLKEGIGIARAAGISEERIVIDPGIGFGKTARHNLKILRELAVLNRLNRPILVGPSRKSFIGRVLAAPPDERIMGTAASVTIAIANGAHIIRVHDVSQMAQVARLTDAILTKG